MSFIDLMAHHDWSEADIVNRTEAMVREHFSASAEAILNRKVLGRAQGLPMTAEQSAALDAEVAQFAQVTLTAQAAGVQARADMGLLRQAFAVEAAERRLALPAVEPVWQAAEEGDVLVNAEAVDADQGERAEAQAVLDTASPEALALVEQRRPPLPPEPKPEGEEGEEGEVQP